jgi:inorganic phosphate transporter, PiT family
LCNYHFMFGIDPSLSLLLLFCIISALAFEFINGFHDTANAVATVIYTHSLRPGVAVFWSGLWNFIGVNIGGIAVAIGIINLLPVEALTDANIYHNLAMVMALIITAIIWNIGTWYLGIPCSSSHTLIGSITGVSIAFMLLPGNHDITLNWTKVTDAGLSLIISPLIGFFLAMIFMFILRITVINKAIFKEPPAKKAPPMWIRSILILSSTFVSFSHGSNDGQKGVGLIMIILISIVPMKFSIDLSKDPSSLRDAVVKTQRLTSRVNDPELSLNERADLDRILLCLDSLNNRFTGILSFSQISHSDFVNTRKDILIISKHANLLVAQMREDGTQAVNPAWINDFSDQVKQIRTYTEYSPWWVIFMISIALGLGTMIGWKRIVVTIGEKIGKSHLTYAQGATANFIAAGTISASSALGLPVSTTHVLSSGVAGTMVSGNGTKNLQARTLTAIGIAWLITIPVTMLFSGVLFLLIRILFT